MIGRWLAMLLDATPLCGVRPVLAAPVFEFPRDANAQSIATVCQAFFASLAKP